jgi:dGTPase
MAEAERGLKRFLYASLYHHPSQLEAAAAARKMVDDLFASYATHPPLMPAEWRDALPAAEPARSRHIADFIAGMTDRYAIKRYREVVGPLDLPEGF